MPKCLTTEEFIEKARAVHGDRYDYSQVEYAKSTEKVTIICPEQHVFRQTPNSHLGGAGCRYCAGRGHTTATFIKKAREVHGDRYDYSLVKYTKTDEKVSIICREPGHGEFPQTPNQHLQGYGCDICGGSNRHTTESFIEKAIAKHGDRYDYSLVEYGKNNREEVTIICREPGHDPFPQTPHEHLAGNGCPDCGGTKPLDAEQFKKRAIAVHGDRYDYSLVEYVNYFTDVTIVCPKPGHGPFPQVPVNHIRQESGCPECSGNKPLTTETFIKRAIAKHGCHYDYSLVEYVNAKTEVQIKCPEPDHGVFPQIPDNHLTGQGCPDCSETGFNPNDRGVLYYIAITTDDGDMRYKIGITNSSVAARFGGSDLARVRIVKTWQYAIGREAATREAEILRQYAGDKYTGPPILQSGNTELFTHDVLGLDKE